MDTPKPGSIMWTDLTVPDATAVSDFYKAVTGWEREGLHMGDYEDYIMKGPEGNPVAGICHAGGQNRNIPPQWMIYITVADLDASIAQCEALGGKVLSDKRAGGNNMFYCLVQDPVGAHFMLYGPSAQ